MHKGCQKLIRQSLQKIVLQAMNQQQKTTQITIDQLYRNVERRFNRQVPQSQVSKQIIANFQLIQQRAKQKNPKASFLLGRAYVFGYACTKNIFKAKNLYRQAKDMGEVHSIYNLYFLEKIEQERSKLLEQGILKGQERCIDQKIQKHIKTDNSQLHREAEELIHQLGQRGYLRSYYVAWLLYTKQNSEFFNAQKAKEHLKIWHSKSKMEQTWEFYYAEQLANIGKHAQALQELLYLYDNFEGLAQKRTGEIQKKIGQCYQQLHQNNEAETWYKKSMYKKYIPSFNCLAVMYSQERKHELQKQVLYKSIKCQNDDNNTLSIVNYNLAISENNEGNSEQSYKFYYEGSRFQNQDSDTFCGVMLFRGEGVNKDQFKGRHIVNLNYEKDNEMAIRYYAEVSKTL